MENILNSKENKKIISSLPLELTIFLHKILYIIFWIILLIIMIIKRIIIYIKIDLFYPYPNNRYSIEIIILFLFLILEYVRFYLSIFFYYFI